MSCLFCTFGETPHHPRMIKTFEHCYAIYDAYPVTPGHILIIPYYHTENWFTASSEIQHNIMAALDEMKQFLDEEFVPHGYNIGMNCGIVSGQTIFHLHVHLIPRYQGDMADPKGGVRGVIPEKQKY